MKSRPFSGFLRRDLKPSHTFALAMIVAISGLWSLMDVLLRLPKAWAMPAFLFSIFVSPALPFACWRQFRELGFQSLLLLALFLSIVGIVSLGVTFYVLLHGQIA